MIAKKLQNKNQMAWSTARHHGTLKKVGEVESKYLLSTKTNFISSKFNSPVELS